MGDQQPHQTRLIKPKTKRGRRILQQRAPKAVEDAKRALLLYGNTTSLVVKNVLIDLHKMKGLDVQKFTRKNRDIRPFETGGEASLEFYAAKSFCGLFALASHSKKRPHNLTLGRLYDGHLYDAVELGVEGFRPISSFGGAATSAQQGNKPSILFVGEKFESVPVLKQTKSLVLDFFRGQQVESINLAGLDRVIVAVALGDSRVMLRQYAIRLKKSGTAVPRVALEEMGPRLDLSVRRHRLPPAELEKAALKQPKLGKKKEKNVGSDTLDGRVGRIYMPKQKVDELALNKMKGVRRERREGKKASVEDKQRRAALGGGGEGGATPDGGRRSRPREEGGTPGTASRTLGSGKKRKVADGQPVKGLVQKKRRRQMEAGL